MCCFYVSVGKNKIIIKNKNKQPPAALMHSLHCVYSASSPMLCVCTPATAACACTFTFSHCVCLCVPVCLHIRARPADSPLSARHGDKFTLPSSPVDVEVCEKITIDIAMVTVTRIATCFVCVRARAWRPPCVLWGLVVLFQRYRRRHAGWATGITASAAGK